MIHFASNIRYIRNSKKLTQEHFASELGIKKGRLGSYEEGRAEPPFSLLKRMADLFGQSIDVLIRHDLSKAGANTPLKLDNQRTLFPIQVDREGNDVIEVIGQKAQAGYLNGYADPEYIEALPQMNLPFMPTGKHRAFPIKGDSMPPLKDGSFVVGKYIERIDEVKDGRTYVVVTSNDGIVYKRVYNHIDEDGTIHLHSDNRAYDPFNIPYEDVLEIWEFVCNINTQEYTEEDLNVNSIMQMMQKLRIELKMLKQQVIQPNS